MKIGCPKEIKNNENRVGLTPQSARSYVERGHTVYIQSGAGEGSAFTDADYVAAGCVTLPDAAAVWAQSDMIVKVKEPLADEYCHMRAGQLIYTYFHFAANKELTEACLKARITALAYETVQLSDRSLPLLRPMSEVAGRMASLMGAFYSARMHGGRGVLPSGVTGVAPANVLVIGGGVVGANAARVAAGMGCRVSILDLDLARLDYLGDVMPANVQPLFCDPAAVTACLKEADIVVGAVLVPGAVAPKLIRREHLPLMKPGAVMVDVAIDQGGCFETSRATTHADPVFITDGIVHYCVANMPGAYARTSTIALNNATVSYGLQLADKGFRQACRDSEPLRHGLNMHDGFITFDAVAKAFDMENLYIPAEKVFA